MTDDKISANPAIDAALHLDGDPTHIKRYYDAWSASYNRDTSCVEYNGPGIASELLTQHLPKLESRLLDAGCGTGLVGAKLHAAGYRNIDGFDLSTSMADLALAGGHYQQVLGGIDMMQATQSYPAAGYDAVLSVGVFTLGHVPPEALAVLLHLVRPAGLLIVSTRKQYYDETSFQQQVDDLIAAQRLSLRRLIEDAPYNSDGDGHYWVFTKTA